MEDDYSPFDKLMSVLAALERMVDRAETELRREKEAFTAAHEEVQLLAFQARTRQELDIGGEIFATSTATLQRKGDHLLSVMASNIFATEMDGVEATFLDRDPRHFPLVLAYLREGEVLVPTRQAARSALRRELHYYCLPSFRDPAGILLLPINSDACGEHPHNPFLDDTRTLAALYRVPTEAWELFEPGDMRQWHVTGSCSSGNHLYVLTGRYHGLHTLVWFDPDSLRCEVIATHPVICAVSGYFILEVVGNCLVIMCTADDPGMPHVFDLRTRQWLRHRLTRLSACGACVVDETLYVSDQRGDIRYARPNQDTWRRLSPAPITNRLPVLVAWRGLVVVIGGFNQNCDVADDVLASPAVQTYNPRKRTWCALPPMTTPRFLPTAAIAEDCLFVIGGLFRPQDSQDMWAPEREMERYDPEAGRWIDCGAVPGEWGSGRAHPLLL